MVHETQAEVTAQRTQKTRKLAPPQAKLLVVLPTEESIGEHRLSRRGYLGRHRRRPEVIGSLVTGQDFLPTASEGKGVAEA